MVMVRKAGRALNNLDQSMIGTCAVHIHITGIVQGVGFRPFVYNMAMRSSLCGWVRNSSSGVDIVVEGPQHLIEKFSEDLVAEKPPLATIDEVVQNSIQPEGFSTFEIIASKEISGAFQPISPDVSICADCLRELLDPQDLRYRYPFINCTNCGPRFTIIKAIPYDRPNTTMASFKMCAACESQYNDPSDRRFHAQPVACSECGPHVWLEMKVEPQKFESQSPKIQPQTEYRGDLAIIETQHLLNEGAIVAIKGLGGFHLACDGLNSTAVSHLRQRKLRVDKPFALMMPDIATVEEHCFVNNAERAMLESRERPIVILERRPGCNIAEDVAPNQNTLGVMLPYTPLHYLLFLPDDQTSMNEQKSQSPPSVLVMTSGNLSEEPIAIENEEARQRLMNLTNAFLMHNRPIHTRTDNSVTRIIDIPTEQDQHQPTSQLLRRSRGYAPYPFRLPWKSPPMLATGAELKNTFCLVRDQYAFLSHHIGDLENYETLRGFEDGIKHFEQLFLINPEFIACDMHPNYLATRYAQDRAQQDGLPIVEVQHHHAHIAACMLEHQLPKANEVIGVALDGTGFGDDGAIWGGEFILASYHSYQRLYHLAYTSLPGGDRAIREPWRMALSWLDTAGLDWNPDLPPLRHVFENKKNPDQVLAVINHQIETGLNSTTTSSMGRLFDAVSALMGIRQEVNYEAQAAIEMEQLIDPNEHQAYPFHIPGANLSNTCIDINATPVIEAVVADVLARVSPRVMAARFHRGVADMIGQICLSIRTSCGSNVVALSGGVWQNLALLSYTHQILQNYGFKVLVHQQLPPNDGGIAIGQAAVAFNQLQT